MELNKEIKQYIILRKDLKMRPGKAISQGSHVAVNSILDSIISENQKHIKWIMEWRGNLFKKITLKVNSEDDLIKYYHLALKNNLPTFLVKDKGLTQFKEETFTAVSIGPAPTELINSLIPELKNLNLY